MATGSGKKIGIPLKDDGRLHKLCRDGKLNDIENLFETVPHYHLSEFLNRRRGFFGYTPLHDAISGNQPSIIAYLAHKGADINACASSGYTPLHLAASAGYIDCVKSLLDTGADISVKDNFEKTPMQTAELGGKTNIVRLLRSEEIIKEAKTEGDSLTLLLKPIKKEDLEPHCLEKALRRAVEAGKHFNVGKLLIKGATNIEEALNLAKTSSQYKVCAVLLLVMAAQMNDTNLVQILFGDSSIQHALTDYDDFPEVQKIINNVSTVVPIEMARLKRNHAVREKLLLNTNVNQEVGSVNWQGLRLLALEVFWFRKIFWVKELLLAKNGLRSMNNEIGNYLKQVVKLDLQHNELVMLPRFIFELPNLIELNLSYNQLKSIPDVHEWSPELTFLNLSHNQLSSLPLDVTAESIKKLDLSYNLFRSIPLCICSMTTLTHLNISFNRDILSLPVEMGSLLNLDTLLIDGLKDLSEPPRHLHGDARECINYLYARLKRAQRFYRMKLVLLGDNKAGKTTLCSRLLGRNPDDFTSPGLHMREWSYAESIGRRRYQFTIWDFEGHDVYRASYRCFLSARSIYLLVWDLTQGEEGILKLKSWLDSLASRAPQSCVLIVGTHLDLVEHQQRSETDALLRQVRDLAQTYQNKLVSLEILAVGLMNDLENIKLLRDAIYNNATVYKGGGREPFMGREIPGSYITLQKELEKCQNEVIRGVRNPVMSLQQFREFLHESKLYYDIFKEFHDVTRFLNDIGTIIHYDVASFHINDLYFIYPPWLYETISKLIDNRSGALTIKNGILNCRDIPHLIRDSRFPWNYFDRFISLLDHFEIALPLDRYRILVPSTLPDNRPEEAEIIYTHTVSDLPLYTRFILFSKSCPSGFWGRLLSHLMCCLPQLRQVLAIGSHDNKVSGNVSSVIHEERREGGRGKGGRRGGRGGGRGERGGGRGEGGGGRGKEGGRGEGGDKLVSVKANEAFVDIKTPQRQPDFSLINVTHVSVENESVLNPNDVEVIYWKEGLVYKGPEVSFVVESLQKSKVVQNTLYRGVVIMTSPSEKGIKLMCQLIDIIISLIKVWYPGLTDENFAIDQRALCYECRKINFKKPFEFNINQYRSNGIADCNGTVVCEYGHTVSLIDVMPELLLSDIDGKLFFNLNEIKYQPDQVSLLGQGGFGIVHHGRYQGGNVAIKKYLSTRESDHIPELYHEAKMLQTCRHPCIVKLVGISVSPLVILVLEEAPLGSLDTHLIKKGTPIPRLVMFRIAAQVAAALHFLHQRGILFRGLKPADVLLWSLDESSLCHSKLTDFGVATQLGPLGVRNGLFVRCPIPEVVSCKTQSQAVYNHKADIFTYGILLYHMITRRRPFHNINPSRVETKIARGQLPSTSDVSLADIGYYNLTRLMEDCLRYKPEERPDAARIVTNLTYIYCQSMMGKCVTKSNVSLCHGCAVTPQDYTRTTRYSSELWLCCKVKGGHLLLDVYDTNKMNKIKSLSIEEDNVQCMCICGDHLWVCVSHGKKSGIIHLYDIDSHELVHTIYMSSDIIVTCMTCTDTTVYMGTANGNCYGFTMDLATIKGSEYRPLRCYVSEYPIAGIIVTEKSVWVSHNRFIFFLNRDDLHVAHFYKKSQKINSPHIIGRLSRSPSCNIIWGADLNNNNDDGHILSAWDKERETHLYDIDMMEALRKNNDYDFTSAVITCIAPILDVVWVAMETGHILLFHELELVTTFRPYNSRIQFLIPILCEGPCQKEKCMILSGANVTTSDSVEGYTGSMILFEGYSSTTLYQMKGLEKRAGLSYLNDYESVADTIISFHFQDHTNVLEKVDKKDDSRLSSDEKNDDYNYLDSEIEISLLSSATNC